MNDSLAHTAEHAFIGSLQSILRQNLKVRKVEHRRPNSGTAFIVIPGLDLDTVVRAEKITNDLIAKGRAVRMQSFESLEAAKAAIPSLRANEERISGAVRVVEIEGHDVAACSMEHASNLSECEFFLVTRLAKSGEDYEIDFVVSDEARKEAILLSQRLLAICTDIGANPNTLEPTVRKLKIENDSNLRKLNALTAVELEKLSQASRERKYGRPLSIIAGVTSNLSDAKIMDFAGEKIKSAEAVIVCIANIVEASARVVLARNEMAGSVDLDKVFARHAGSQGKGGGRPHFVTGVVPSASAEDFVTGAVKELSA